jgi:hypothetical protein
VRGRSRGMQKITNEVLYNFYSSLHMLGRFKWAVFVNCIRETKKIFTVFWIEKVMGWDHFEHKICTS